MTSTTTPNSSPSFQSYPQSFITFAQRSKWKNPTPLQQQLWPEILQRKDCLAISPTNSGKTLGFLLPMIPIIEQKRNRNNSSKKNNKIIGGSGGGGFLTGLILAPTRELVAQIAQEAKWFENLFSITVTCIYGGKENPNNIITSDIIVATPGRGIDVIIVQQLVSLKNIEILVLDECDKLLQMGFKKDLDQLINQIPKTTQVILTSATSSKETKEASKCWLWKGKEQTSYIVVDSVDNRNNNNNNSELNVVDTTTTATATNSTNSVKNSNISPSVIQTIHVCAEHKKPRKLIRHIDKIHTMQQQSSSSSSNAKRNKELMIIFCNRIKTVQFVYEFLQRQKLRVIAFHGNLTQEKREQILNEFKAGKYECLVATDVAGRGLHVSNVKHIVNYDFPSNIETYIHRVGRAGRGRQGDHHNIGGTALSFFTRNLQPLARDLVTILQSTNQFVDPNLLNLVDNSNVRIDGEEEDGGGGDGNNNELLVEPNNNEDNNGNDEIVVTINNNDNNDDDVPFHSIFEDDHKIQVNNNDSDDDGDDNPSMMHEIPIGIRPLKKFVISTIKNNNNRNANNNNNNNHKRQKILKQIDEFGA
jgi:ATP-dependent RNA helicase DDX5/DBP2